MTRSATYAARPTLIGLVTRQGYFHVAGDTALCRIHPVPIGPPFLIRAVRLGTPYGRQVMLFEQRLRPQVDRPKVSLEMFQDSDCFIGGNLNSDNHINHHLDDDSILSINAFTMAGHMPTSGRRRTHYNVLIQYHRLPEEELAYAVQVPIPNWQIGWSD